MNYQNNISGSVSTGHHNGLKTMGLFILMWTLLLAVGAVVAYSTNRPVFLYIFAAFGLIQTFYVYWNSAKLALRSMGARPVTPQQAPMLYNIVTELSERAGQPMPAIYIAPTMTPNAFATGRNPKNAAVCCTEGILQLLNERELRAVLGHELMHVYNRDILTSSIAAAMGGIISTVAQMLFWVGGGDRDSRNNPFGIIATIGIIILGPIASLLIQMAISRTREYDADEDGAQLTGDPLALASALRKLEQGVQANPMRQEPRVQQVASMMITSPFRQALSTHPPIEKRIRRLEKMAGY